MTYHYLDEPFGDRPPLDAEETHAQRVWARADQICPAEDRAGGDINKVPCEKHLRQAEAELTR